MVQRSHTVRNRVLLVLIILAIAALGLFWYLNSKNSLFSAASATSAPSSQKKAAVAKVALPVSLKPAVSTTLQNSWSSIIAGSQTGIDIAVYDHVSGETAHYTNVGGTFNTASTVKLSILEELLLQDQAAGQSLTGDQLAVATPMIENSDNDSATDLWDEVGGVTAMNGFFSQVGATSTTAATDWGLTQTTALDQVAIVKALAYPGSLLTATSATAADTLLDNVESDQSWGVSGGVPSGVTVELKNGWLPDNETNDAYSNTTDWTVNSIGHVYGNGVDYSIAVFTDGDATEQTGINMIESLSAATWNDLAAQ